MKIKNRLDFVTGIGMIAFCTVVLTQTSKLSVSVAMFPRAIMAVGIGIGAAVVIKSFLIQPFAEKNHKPFDGFSVIELLLLLFVLVILTLVKILGLFCCTFTIMAAISTYITYCRYGRNFKQIALMFFYNVAVIVVLYVLFKVVLDIRTPDGIFL